MVLEIIFISKILILMTFCLLWDRDLRFLFADVLGCSLMIQQEFNSFSVRCSGSQNPVGGL